MLSFRKKVFLSGFLLFIILTMLLFPFVEAAVSQIMKSSLERKTRELALRLQKASTLDQIIEMMKGEEAFLLKRAALYSFDGEIMYDAEEPWKGGQAPQVQVHPEVLEAMHKGAGYSEAYLKDFEEKIANFAIVFDLRDQKYILKATYSLDQVEELTTDFKIGFLCLVTFVLLLYSLMSWAVVERLSRPIQEILQAILPYQEGKVEFLPKIKLSHITENNEFSRLASTVNSLTEKIQKQIENLVKLRKETEAILESLGEGVIAVDTQAKVSFVNGVALKMLKTTHRNMIGKSFDELHLAPKELCEEAKALLQKTLLLSKPEVKTWVQKEGTKRFIDLTAAPLAQQEGAILVLQDKTSDYKIVEMGKDFIANASHELKTPITIIRGFAETLQDLPNLSPAMQKEMIGKIVKTCERLDKLVKSLLTLADIENFSEKQFQRADLLILCENCKHLLLTAHPKANISIQSTSKKIPALIDPDLFELGLMNLLENAVKYSASAAKIEILLEKKNREIVITARDQGIGIPESDLCHIFDRFYTVDKARSRKSGGAGLGLSIVKTIVDKHKGSIEAFSEVGQGTKFVIKLPL